MDSDSDSIMLERCTPVPVGIGAAWLVLVLSFGSGLAAFVGVGLLCVAFHAPVAVAVAASGAAVLVVWLRWLSRVESLVFVREMVRTAPEPERMRPPRPVVSLEIAEPERGRVSFLDVPCSVEQLTALGRGLCAGRPFAEDEWSGAGAAFSRREFRRLRAALLERGFLAWRDAESPTLGVRLTSSGEALARYLADGVRPSAYVRDAGGRAMLTSAE
jgi:hypothetical protein